MVHKHQGWRLVTCIWLHAGVVHLVVNMLSLVFIGIRIEQQFGFGIYFSVILLVYLGLLYLVTSYCLWKFFSASWDYIHVIWIWG